ncbi:MAG: tRNA (N6-isopentenyl adenosine(37)-C2)-methylthiotransferase MiaB [Candidatus Sumerlaeota bacterium]
MPIKTYKIISFGCQMNAYDSEVMAGVLEARGLEPIEEERDADVVFMNTCIVRASAENRAWARIRQWKPLKEKHPERIFAVTGCLAQRDAEALLDRAPFVDLVLGTRSIPNLPALLDHLERGGDPIACTDEFDTPYETDSVAVRRSSLRSLVTIMQGCNNWCSYCIVPSVRGRERSRPLGAILDEIKALVSCGSREVTLVGQNVNAWRGSKNGREWEEHGPSKEEAELDFADLLDHVNAIEGLERIRYITSHPRDAGERQFNAVADNPKVCDHFHLPAQSGSNAILEKMNRGYTREHYLDLIRSIRETMPDAAITTDLIVGFPGESESDFEQTLDLVKEVRYDAAFTFYYNPRSGTRAAEWEDDVDLDTKKDRLARLIEIQEAISLEKNRAWEGREMEILVEGPARRARAEEGKGNMMGRTTGDKCVVYDGDPEDKGHLVRVRITEGASHTLFGKQLS